MTSWAERIFALCASPLTDNSEAYHRVVLAVSTGCTTVVAQLRAQDTVIPGPTGRRFDEEPAVALI